jgi:hypothetical protein
MVYTLGAPYRHAQAPMAGGLMFFRRKTARWIALMVVSAGFVAAQSAFSQDLSTFLAPPPEPGAWAHYRVVTKAPGDQGPGKVENLSLAVTGSEYVEGTPCVWVEAGPQNFLTDKDGTLKLLLKARPSPKEALNFLMQAQKAQYAPLHGEPYALGDGVLGFIRNRAAGIVVEQEREELPPEEVVLASGRRVKCSRFKVTTRISKVPFTSTTTEEKGIYWKSPETPFNVVKAEIVRTETGKGPTPRVRNVSLILIDDGFKGAVSVIPKPPEKVRGLWSLLFN